jgi:hypothetical protein
MEESIIIFLESVPKQYLQAELQEDDKKMK